MGKRAVRPLEVRFWEKVDRGGPDECWPWMGQRNAKGYGHFYIDRRATIASRFALALDGRDVPPGMIAMHSCDNPPCVNPAHLQVGTHGDNRRDMYAKGRGGYVRTPQSRKRLSESIKAIWAEHPERFMTKTHCPSGHPYDETNTYWYGRHRLCRACNRERARKRAAA